MKKIISAIVLMVTVMSVGFAQNDANAILNRVSNKLKNTKGASASFSYSTKDKNGHNLGTIAGSIALKGNKYYIKQGNNEIYCNGQKTWNFNGKDEVTVNNVDNSTGTLNPQKLLSGDFFTKDFTSKLISSQGSIAVIELIPTDKRKNFTKVEVYVNKTRNLITKATVYEKAGNIISFSLSNVNTDVTLADSKFTFNPKAHPGVEVID